jgi:hypothetical protein
VDKIASRLSLSLSLSLSPPCLSEWSVAVTYCRQLKISGTRAKHSKRTVKANQHPPPPSKLPQSPPSPLVLGGSTEWLHRACETMPKELPWKLGENPKSDYGGV